MSEQLSKIKLEDYFSNVTKEMFIEHRDFQKELGIEEYEDFKKDYPLICSGIYDEKEFQIYVTDMNNLLF